MIDDGPIGAGTQRLVRTTLLEHGQRRVIDWQDLRELDWSRFGLVLGAGGATGAAFEAGILLALEIDHGTRLADASSVVGTSAGAIGAALIGLGFEAGDIAAVIAETYDYIDAGVADMGVRFSHDVPVPPPLLRMLRFPLPIVALRSLTKLARRQYAAGLLGMVRHGVHDVEAQLTFLDAWSWSHIDRDVRICAAELGSGRSVVLDATSSLPLVSAVAASCAVPGVLRPVAFGGKLLVDGGIASPTRADLLAGEAGADLVVVVSPMSGNRSRTVMGAATTRFAMRRLRSELKRFDPDQRVVVIEPIAALSELVVDDALASHRSHQVLGTSFVSASIPAG